VVRAGLEPGCCNDVNTCVQSLSLHYLDINHFIFQLSDSDLLNCFVATHCDMSDVDPNEVGDNWSLEWDAVNSCKFYYNS
jgi:hypothetical protein